MSDFGQINCELELAILTRTLGNEGKARVHARRAAGWAIRSYFQNNSNNEKGKSAFTYLEDLILDSTMPDYVREAAANLTVRITVEHQLPVETDIIDDARAIVSYFADVN